MVLVVRFFTCVFAGVIAVAGVQTLYAGQISEIAVGPTFVNYTTSSSLPNDQNFAISGTPALNQFTILYDGTSQIVSEPSLNFTMSSTGMDSLLWNGGLDLSFSASSDTGSLMLFDVWDATNPYLTGELLSLELAILDPALGAFTGSGSFDVTGGSLMGDFGSSGGVVSIGLSFSGNIPLDFNTGFVGFTSASLFPTDVPSPVPEPASTLMLVSFGLALLGLVRVVRRQPMKRVEKA